MKIIETFLATHLKLNNGHDDGKDGKEKALKSEANEENDTDWCGRVHDQTRLWVRVGDATSCENGNVRCRLEDKIVNWGQEHANMGVLGIWGYQNRSKKIRTFPLVVHAAHKVVEDHYQGVYCYDGNVKLEKKTV